MKFEDELEDDEFEKEFDSKKEEVETSKLEKEETPIEVEDLEKTSEEDEIRKAKLAIELGLDKEEPEKEEVSEKIEELENPELETEETSEKIEEKEDSPIEVEDLEKTSEEDEIRKAKLAIELGLDKEEPEKEEVSEKIEELENPELETEETSEKIEEKEDSKLEKEEDSVKIEEIEKPESNKKETSDEMLENILPEFTQDEKEALENYTFSPYKFGQPIPQPASTENLNDVMWDDDEELDIYHSSIDNNSDSKSLDDNPFSMDLEKEETFENKESAVDVGSPEEYGFESNPLDKPAPQPASTENLNDVMEDEELEIYHSSEIDKKEPKADEFIDSSMETDNLSNNHSDEWLEEEDLMGTVEKTESQEKPEVPEKPEIQEKPEVPEKSEKKEKGLLKKLLGKKQPKEQTNKIVGVEDAPNSIVEKSQKFRDSVKEAIGNVGESLHDRYILSEEEVAMKEAQESKGRGK